MKKITFITTVNHNVGDDFVREGLKHLLKNYFKGEDIAFENVHKHSPITSRYGFEKIRKLRLSMILDNLIPLNFTQDRILNADLLVQSGAPVYWCHKKSHCCLNEWYTPLIKKRFLRNKHAKFLNLAAGSFQGYNSKGDEFCEQCNKYIKEMFDFSVVTTVRDKISQNILNRLNLSAELIPCSSIFAADEFSVKKREGEYIVVNYMEGAGHQYSFRQKIDLEKWRRKFSEFYFKIKQNDQVVFACHDKKEIQWANEIDPQAKIFFSEDFYEYIKFYSKAKMGIMNRVHGAYLIAAFGRPSLIVGSDSRAKMAEEIGLESVFVDEVDLDVLLGKYESLIKGVEKYSDRFYSMKQQAFFKYMEQISKIQC